MQEKNSFEFSVFLQVAHQTKKKKKKGGSIFALTFQGLQNPKIHSVHMPVVMMDIPK